MIETYCNIRVPKLQEVPHPVNINPVNTTTTKTVQQADEACAKTKNMSSRTQVHMQSDFVVDDNTMLLTM
jgi:hypothetical protein